MKKNVAVAGGVVKIGYHKTDAQSQIASIRKKVAVGDFSLTGPEQAALLIAIAQRLEVL